LLRLVITEFRSRDNCDARALILGQYWFFLIARARPDQHPSLRCRFTDEGVRRMRRLICTGSALIVAGLGLCSTQAAACDWGCGTCGAGYGYGYGYGYGRYAASYGYDPREYAAQPAYAPAYYAPAYYGPPAYAVPAYAVPAYGAPAYAAPAYAPPAYYPPNVYPPNPYPPSGYPPAAYPPSGYPPYARPFARGTYAAAPGINPGPMGINPSRLSGKQGFVSA